MTRETKVGVAMVMLLVGVFGFLVYKRFTRPVDAVAVNEQPADEEAGDAPEGDRLELDSEDEFPAATGQREPKILPVAGSTRQIPQDEPEGVDDPFGGASGNASSAPSGRPKLPTMIPDEEPAAEDAGAFVAQEEPDAGDGQDPFLDTPGEVSSSPPKATASPPVMQFIEESPVEDVSRGAEPAPVVRAPAVAVPVRNSREPAFGETDIVTVKARAKHPEPSFDFEEDATEEDAPELALEPGRPSETSPAPRLMLDDSDEDRYGEYEPIELVDGQSRAAFASAPKTDFFSTEPAARQSAVTIAGDSHVVQSGENFWSISQKKYGTGRYFQALAAYNQARVPDAAKMKSGVTIGLPPADELQRRFPNLIPKGGPSEPAAADGQANLPGEFLTDQAGRPMYRIGAKDTLSGIAQKYLGRSSRWMQIFEMNRDVLKDGNSLKVGAVLRLPSDAGELQLTNQPRAFR